MPFVDNAGETSLTPFPPAKRAAEPQAAIQRANAQMPAKQTPIQLPLPPTMNLKAIAARENGALSRGPVTEEGKASSSRNALKHGLCSAKTIAVSDEEREEFEQFRDAMVAHYEPQDVVQDTLVDRIVTSAWRLRRVVAYEGVAAGSDPKAFVFRAGQCYVNLSNYETRIERSLFRTIEKLDALQAAKTKK